MNRNRTYSETREESQDRLKSGAITAAVWAGLLLFLFLYKVVENIPKKTEVETRMLINFGDNTNGSGAEEPANQKGSLAAATNIASDAAPAAAPQAVTTNASVTATAKNEDRQADGERIITGSHEKKTVKMAEKPGKSTTAKPAATAKTTKSGSSKASNSSTGSGDGKASAAVGNLLRGKGSKAGSQGTDGDSGNAGDPLGGAGNGDSKVGMDRRLTGFIPGTMGRGGAQPAHNCTASGTITIAYTVDKAGNVISARRSSGTSDPCVVATSVSWVKAYVKAEKASTTSTGTYRITF